MPSSLKGADESGMRNKHVVEQHRPVQTVPQTYKNIDKNTDGWDRHLLQALRKKPVRTVQNHRRKDGLRGQDDRERRDLSASDVKGAIRSQFRNLSALPQCSSQPALHMPAIMEKEDTHDGMLSFSLSDHCDLQKVFQLRDIHLMAFKLSYNGFVNAPGQAAHALVSLAKDSNSRSIL